LEREGVDLNRVIAGHVTGVSADIVEALIKRGLYAEFDTLGFPFITGAPPVDTRPNIETIIELINRGYADRILLSQDVCTKFHLHKHGGSGYDFVLTDVAPHLLARGIDQSVIDQLLIHNPARIFAFEAPRSLDG
jgi:phosphotriesterase-related protein